MAELEVLKNGKYSSSSSAIASELDQALQRLKARYHEEIQGLLEQKQQLEKQVSSLESQHSTALQDAEQLNSKNLYLVEMNNDLSRQLQTAEQTKGKSSKPSLSSAIHSNSNQGFRFFRKDPSSKGLISSMSMTSIPRATSAKTVAEVPFTAFEYETTAPSTKSSDRGTPTFEPLESGLIEERSNSDGDSMIERKLTDADPSKRFWKKGGFGISKSFRNMLKPGETNNVAPSISPPQFVHSTSSMNGLNILGLNETLNGSEFPYKTHNFIPKRFRKPTTCSYCMEKVLGDEFFCTGMNSNVVLI